MLDNRGWSSGGLSGGGCEGAVGQAPQREEVGKGPGHLAVGQG